ncbi:hypothetical protein HYV88_00110 [Candidatus Woesearchaeota archaeon]|nr:hypothetical protein [Candidatus Woesearchaeota archaeon]
MKIYAFMVLSIILLVGFVSANNKLSLDVNLEKEMLVPVLEDDMIEFYLGDARHIINIEKVMPESMDLDVFLFVDEEQKTSYVTVKENRTIRLDLDKDGVGDLFLGYGGHYNDKTLLLIYNPNAEGSLTEITGNVVKKTNNISIGEENNNKWYYIVGILALVVVLIGTLIYINIKKKRPY